jgi:hypothetical protein
MILLSWARIQVGQTQTGLTRPGERVSKFLNGRGMAERCIKEGKQALRRTRLSCLAPSGTTPCACKLFALAYTLANLLLSLALLDMVAPWSLTTLRERLVKIRARILRHGRHLVFRLAEVARPRSVFAAILCRIDRLRGSPVAS